jgi:hypothetical protein
VTSRDYEVEQMNLKSRTETFKILFKLFAYFLFFVIVLSAAMLSKLSLLTMLNAYKVDKQPDVYKLRWSMMLCTAISIPYLLSFLSCLQTVLFSSTDASGIPKLLVIIWVFLVEIGQSLGIVLMLFRVLPFVQNSVGLFCMSAVCFVPGILKIIFGSRRGQTHFKKMCIVIVDFLAILAQASIWFIFIMASNAFSSNENSLSSIINFNAMTKELFSHISTNSSGSSSTSFIISLVTSTCLISLGWWENFAQV